MKKEEICRKIIDLGKDSQRTIVYYLVISEDDFTELEKPVKSYGVAIEVKERNELTAVSKITTRTEKANRLLDLLASNFVTPVSLYDVVYDWLGQ